VCKYRDREILCSPGDRTQGQIGEVRRNVASKQREPPHEERAYLCNTKNNGVAKLLLQ
jgi:hypothetical protein